MCRTLKQTRLAYGGWPLAIFSLCAIVFPPTPSERVFAQAGSCLVTTSGVRSTACAVMGAAPTWASRTRRRPTGELRWRPPQPRAPWAPTCAERDGGAANCPAINPTRGAGRQRGLPDAEHLDAGRARRPARPGARLATPGGFLAASSNFPAAMASGSPRSSGASSWPPTTGSGLSGSWLTAR